MKFLDYIESTQEEFDKYLDERLVQKNEHPDYPLNLYCYGRKATYDNVWDKVTTRCRGIIVHRETGEIVARPFSKFFNLGTANMPETDPALWENDWPYGQPVVWEKLDGFMCTGYYWEGKWHVASKGSFTSPHAKWATNWLQNEIGDRHICPGFTPMFEGITPNLRIVVDYGKKEALILTALINNETGEEATPTALYHTALTNGLLAAGYFDMTWQDAAKTSLDTSVKNEEGYVLTWYRPGTTPFRLKVKYQDYLRLHRLVTTCSPKRILEAIMNGWSTEVEGMMQDSTPWFAKYVTKWKTVFDTEYQRIDSKGDHAFNIIQNVLHSQYLSNGSLPVRKDWALLAQRPEFKEVAALIFARMDGKETGPIIWKMIKNSDLMKSGKVLVDEHVL